MSNDFSDVIVEPYREDPTIIELKQGDDLIWLDREAAHAVANALEDWCRGETAN